MAVMRTGVRLWILAFIVQSVSSATLTNMTKLFKEIFDENHDPNAPPKKPVKVGMRVQLEEIRDIDDVNEILVTRVRVHIWWRDERLKWSWDKYRIASILVPHHTVWKPDIALINDVSEVTSLVAKASPIRIIRRSGQMQWSPVSIFESKCIFDLEYYPYDKQRCEIKMGTINSDDTFISFFSLKCMKLTGKFETSTWSLESIDKYESDLVLNSEVYKKQKVLTCVYTLKRKSAYYVTSMLLPLLLLGLMNPLAFLIPCHSGEKISFAITLFLAFAVYETIIMEKIPVNSDKTSYLQLYIIIQLAFTVLILIVSIIQTRIYEMSAESDAEKTCKTEKYRSTREQEDYFVDNNENKSSTTGCEAGTNMMNITGTKTSQAERGVLARLRKIPCMTKVDIISFFAVLIGQLACNVLFYNIVTQGSVSM